MKRRRFLEVTGAAGAWVAAGGVGSFLASCGERRVAARPAAKRVVVLGVGGMDAGTVERMMGEGKLPNLAALARKGTFAPLGTTTPVEAAVAWAAFATGARPGKNGIFGQFGRDPQTYRPVIADLCYEPAGYVGRWPVLRPRCRSYLSGEPFWRRAAAQGIATAALWAPADFPPEEVEGSFFLSGGNVPDASLGACNYYYFASDRDFPEQETAAGGIWRRVELRNRVGSVSLEAPPGLGGPPLEITFKPETAFYLTISAAGQTQQVTTGTYSDYFVLPFGRGLFGRARFLARFFVVSSSPQVRVWLSSLEVDPRAPFFDVAAPESFGEALAAGDPFGTRGMPLDVAALYDRVIGRRPFAGRYFLQIEEKRRLGLTAWQRYQPDLFLLFDYGLNELARVFWRHYDVQHPAYDADRFSTYADVLEAAYRCVDEALGRFRKAAGGDVAFFVVSAHGNRPFRRSFDLGRWLLENGYLKLAPGARPWGVGAPAPEAALRKGRYRPGVCWEETRACAQGYGQLYLNVRGRERRGTVALSRVDRLKEELRVRLLAARDRGRRVVAAVDDGAQLFAGPRRFCAPDLVVSLADGYRVSWESILGGFAAATFADNTGVVSGGHASLVAEAAPGLLFSNLKLETAGAAVEDIGPTILSILGVEGPAHLDGRPLSEAAR